MFKKIPVYLQHDSNDCGVACLAMITRYHGRTFNYNYLESLCNTTNDGTSMTSIKDASSKIGLEAQCLGISIEQLVELNDYPVILFWNNNHYVILYKVKQSKKHTKFYIIDPTFGPVKFNEDEMLIHWRTKFRNNKEVGYIMTFTPTDCFFEKPEQELRERSRYLEPV